MHFCKNVSWSVAAGKIKWQKYSSVKMEGCTVFSMKFPCKWGWGKRGVGKGTPNTQRYILFWFLGFYAHIMPTVILSTLSLNFYFASRLDGTCRRIAAVLFDLEHTARINDLRSCTSGQCQWIRRAKPNTNSCLLEDLPPFSLIRDLRKQSTSGNVSKISVNHTCYR